MSEIIKVNLKSICIILTIAFILASVVGAAYIGYDNAKDAKRMGLENRVKINAVEKDQAKFEGIIEERTRNIQTDVERIYSIVSNWSPVDAPQTKTKNQK